MFENPCWANYYNETGLLPVLTPPVWDEILSFSTRLLYH